MLDKVGSLLASDVIESWRGQLVHHWSSWCELSGLCVGGATHCLVDQDAALLAAVAAVKTFLGDLQGPSLWRQVNEPMRLRPVGTD